MFSRSGELVEKFRLKYIANNYVITKHATERISEREANLNIKNLILNPFIAYYNTDGTMNIAKDEFHYLVIAYSSRDKKYYIITYKTISHNGINILQKRQMALKGISRKTY